MAQFRSSAVAPGAARASSTTRGCSPQPRQLREQARNVVGYRRGPPDPAHVGRQPDQNAATPVKIDPDGWDHPGARLWPDRDDRGRDLNASPGPAWVDDAARRVRERPNAWVAPVRIGHGDWEPQNIRWSGGNPLAVHDWDSVIAQPEPAIEGLAAAVWPAAGAPGEAATVAQSKEFIAAYQRAADRQWSEQEIQNAWAADLWVRLFNAKKDAANGGGPQLDRLADEVGERLALTLGNAQSREPAC